jgi:hypothetical protein
MSLAHLFRCGLTLISPRLNTKVCYRIKLKKKINLSNPQTLNEKILKMKLERYGTDPLVRQCSDKYAVRSYVEEKGCRDILVPLIAAYDSVDEIRWDDLPQSFAMKWNFGCGFNIICRNKSEMNIEKTKRQMRKWGRSLYYLGYSEMQYKDVRKKIIVETILEDPQNDTLNDYKVYCFHGTPMAILYMSGRYSDNMKAAFFDEHWAFIGDTGKSNYKSIAEPPPEPKSLSKMLGCAAALSEPFEFVRVDFYDIDGALYFGEMTFTPAGAFDVSQCIINGKTMGDLI